MLLVEEYDAVGAAIASALKKFAPRRELTVVRSLAEATSVLREGGDPELIIFDLDPPQTDVVAFLEGARITHAETRGLVITAGGADEILRKRLCPALHFIEKPFEVAHFGALVEALLAAREIASAPGFKGSLRDLNVADLIPLHGLTSATAIVRVSSTEDLRGEIHFVRGEIVHARAGDLSGDHAVQEMLGWHSPNFKTDQRTVTAPRTMRTPWRDLLTLPQLQNRTPPEKAEPKQLPPKPAAAAGKKILVVDDTEMLRIFVEEILISADLTLQITTASTASEGLQAATSIAPDLVLLDFSLPDFHGDEVCRRLLANEQTRRLPVIMMSGHVPEMNAAAMRFENIVATLAKPFLSASLIELVQSTLQCPPAFRPRKPAKPQAPETPPGVDFASKPTPTKQPALTLAKAPSPTPARFSSARSNSVIVGVPVEVISLQFSETLRIASIRARPCASSVLLRMDTGSAAPLPMPPSGFALHGVSLDQSGRIETMRLAPVRGPVPLQAALAPIPISDIAVLRTKDGAALQLAPGPAVSMKVRMVASFEVTSVELSSAFEVDHLLLRRREGPMQLTLHPNAQNAGAEFASAQVLLDRAGRIVELMFDAFAP